MTYYIVLSNGHICRSQIDGTGYPESRETEILNGGVATGYFLLKISDPFADLFYKSKKFSALTIKPILAAAKDGTLKEEDITWP